jgi:hypothetical protein
MSLARLRRKLESIGWLVGAIACVPLVATEGSAQPIGVSPPNGSPTSISALPLQVAAADCKRSRVDFVGQVATGTLGAWIGGIAAYAIAHGIDPSDPRSRGDGSYKPNANTAFAFGAWAGSTALVVRAGRRRGRRQCGSFAGTAVGAAIPTVVLLLGRHEPYLPFLGSLYIAPLLGLGGTLTFPIR